jgi:hypothetical protein
MSGLGTRASGRFSLFLKPGLGMHLMTVVSIPGWIGWAVGGYGLFQMVLLVNKSQPIFSGLHILYNGIFTSMFQVADWNGYTGERKNLRTSTATKVAQREKYSCHCRIAIQFRC